MEGKGNRDEGNYLLGSAGASRAGDDALVIAFFVTLGYDFLKVHFGGGAEISTRGRVRSPENW